MTSFPLPQGSGRLWHRLGHHHRCPPGPRVLLTCLDFLNERVQSCNLPNKNEVIGFRDVTENCADLDFFVYYWPCQYRRADQQGIHCVLTSKARKGSLEMRPPKRNQQKSPLKHFGQKKLWKRYLSSIWIWIFWRSEAKKKSLILGKFGCVALDFRWFLGRNCRHADCEVPDLEYKVANGMPLGEAQMLLGGVLRCQVSQQGRNHFRNSVFLKSNFGMKPNKGSEFWESPIFLKHTLCLFIKECLKPVSTWGRSSTWIFVTKRSVQPQTSGDGRFLLQANGIQINSTLMQSKQNGAKTHHGMSYSHATCLCLCKV